MSSADEVDTRTFLLEAGAAEPALVHPPALSALASEGELIAERYREMGYINGGGMGEIKRVWDTRLGRASAMKIIRSEKAPHARAVERFVREARTTGRLQHPGIVPVHDMGQLEDGRWWFTMQEVGGRTLEDLMAEVHAESTPSGWRSTREGMSFRRLVDALLRVCQAVAYAHVEGYIHRDIKPENVMIGRFGEVMVLDWGLGKLVASMVEDYEPFEDLDAEGSTTSTRAGGVLGSPPYMAPEQARGEVASVGPPADVYALGATLYHLLSGVPPYRGRTARDIIERVKAAPPPPVARAAAGRCPEPDDELARICERAMAREPGDRYATAGELAHALEEWLDGTRRAEEAQSEIDHAQHLLREIEGWRQRSLELRREARLMRQRLPPRPSDRDRAPLWSLEDEADALIRRVQESEAQVEARLMSAIALAPGLSRGHDILADQYKLRLERAVAAGELSAATRWETLLRAHDRGRYRGWLDSGGTLDLVTDPTGAEVILYRLVERERRLVPVRVQSLGRTPLRSVALPRGRLLLEAGLDGYRPTLLPLLVERGDVISHRAPGADEPTVIPLLPDSGSAEREVYVPAGWCLSGGDPSSTDPRPSARVWVDGFVITRFHVTVGEYLEFLNELAGQGRLDSVASYGPCTGRKAGSTRLWQRTMDGRVQFLTSPGVPEAFERPDMPMSHLTWQAAMAYARWRAVHDGLPWRLPHDLEWEKAARGVDGRIWPWGDWTVPGRACIGDTHEGPPRLHPEGAFPSDVSVYGLRQAAGGLRTWCGNAYLDPVPADGGRLAVEPLAWLKPSSHRMIRGGMYTSQPHTARLASRYGAPEDRPYPSVGIRLVRPVG